MTLSAQEKAWIKTVYDRNRLWRKYRWPSTGAILATQLIAIAIIGFSVAQILSESGPSRHGVVDAGICSLFLGFIIGLTFVNALFLPKLRKRDDQIIDFLDKHYPEECPWRKDEDVLKAANDVQRQATSGSAIISEHSV